VHQQVGSNIRGISAGHLDGRTEQRGQSAVIRVGQARDAAGEDDAQIKKIAEELRDVLKDEIG